MGNLRRLKMARKEEFKKITENDIETRSEKVLIKELCKASRDVFEEISTQTVLDLLYSMRDCESPIEQIMALRLHEFLMSRQAYKMEFVDGLDIVDIRNQADIIMDGINYRVDFLISVYDAVLLEGMTFVIECDGHDFHEKTKEQARKDKKRDRDLITNGYMVMRFTGSEIYNNAYIAHEIFRRIKTIMLNRRNGR